MKLVSIIAITLAFILSTSFVSCLNLKKDVPPQSIIIDHTTDPSLHHVIRRNPTVTTETHESAIHPSAERSNMMSFGNNNDSNGRSVPFPDYGKSPEIANPAIYIHSKGKLSVLQETPAHVGWRSEQKTITSFNKDTSKL
jgi:hypothetical protein